jgi:hypothetical protein
MSDLQPLYKSAEYPQSLHFNPSASEQHQKLQCGQGQQGSCWHVEYLEWLCLGIVLGVQVWVQGQVQAQGQVQVQWTQRFWYVGVPQHLSHHQLVCAL